MCPGHLPQPFTGLGGSVIPSPSPPALQAKCNQNCTIYPEVDSSLQGVRGGSTGFRAVTKYSSRNGRHSLAGNLFARQQHLKYGNSSPFARFSPCTKLFLPSIAFPSKEPWKLTRRCAVSQESPGPAAAGQEEGADVQRQRGSKHSTLGQRGSQVQPLLPVATFHRSKARRSRNNNAHR